MLSSYRTFGEPSENAERRMEFAFNAENIVPAFDIPPGSFIPRSIAEAAAAVMDIPEDGSDNSSSQRGGAEVPQRS